MQATEFSYDASRDFEAPRRRTKILFSVFVVITIISYSAELLNPAIEFNAWRTAMYIVLISGGLFLLLFPSLSLRTFTPNRSSYITFRDGILQWNLGGKMQSISVDDVSQVTRSSSQVQFVTKDGTIRILDFYKIANKQKVHEFLEVLHRQFYQKV